MSLEAKAHFNNYDPSSFGWPHHVPDLVPLTVVDPVSKREINFGHCARSVHGVFVALLTELLPLIPGGADFGPKDDWAYSATDDLPDGSWSFHRYGIAFDLNWRENPMGNYSNNPSHGKGVIPYDAANRIARKYGCEYGGTWSGGKNRLGFKDYMHFECHLSPSDAAGVHHTSTSAPSDPLEEVMAMYGSKAEFESAVRRIVREEGNKGFNVRYLLAWTGKFNSIESFMAGNRSGYLSMGSRAAAAAKKKATKR